MIFKLFLLSTLVGLASSACFDNGDKEIGGSCYKFVAQKLSFEDARNWCHYKNPVTASYLAYVPNQFTSNFLASYARSAFGTNDGSFWIGLSRKSGGSWSWDAGFPVGYTNFGDQVGQNYVAESIVNAKWNTFGASDTNFFVCGYDPAAPPTFAPQTPGPSGPTPTMRATTQQVPTTTGPSCTPSTPRTYLHAYSTDLNHQNGEDFFRLIASVISENPYWNTYATVRLDMKNGDDIHYFKDTSTFDQYLHANYPDPSLGYMDNTTGSDMFYILKKFLKNTEFLCGSTIMIAAKRYPNEVEIKDLISDLQRNHVFVYILSSDTPSGGSNPSTMFNLATRTNGYCEFSADNSLADMYSDAQNIAAAPNQIVASNFAVSGKGNLTIPFKVFKDTEAFFEIIFQDHKMDGSLISLNVTVTDELGFEQSSIDYDGNTEQTGFFDGLRGLEKTVQYYLNIYYEYEEGRQEVMQVRMYSGDNPDNWLPFNN